MKSTDWAGLEFIPEEMGKRLRWARESISLSQEKVAEKVGATRTTITRIENGTTEDPHSVLLLRLARVYDISIDWAMTGNEQ